MPEELVISTIHGPRADPALAERLHELSHHGVVEVLSVAPQDLPRRRFHAVTDQGTPCFVALPRSQTLFDGAVLHLDGARAVVVRVGEQQWLRLRPADAAAALALGHLAGHLHWRIRLEATVLLVAVDAPLDSYLARVQPLLDSGQVQVDG